jgi:hypothetical protein
MGEPVRCGGQSPGRVSLLEEPLRWGASTAGGFPSVGDWCPALPDNLASGVELSVEVSSVEATGVIGHGQKKTGN